MKIVDVRLREVGVAEKFACPDDIEIISSDLVIVESDRGFDYGQIVHVAACFDDVAIKDFRKVIRIMTVEDAHQVKENQQRADNDRKICEQRIAESNLDMRLISAEYTFDRSKIIFYFTSENRVDFRDLVKALAKEFKTRIEMRQIGVRDEAKMFGGLGTCGQKLCCSRFLQEFVPVSIKMAKEQNLPLNPQKISGICGRLMCCLAYENQTYREINRSLPREGSTLQTAKGKAKVLKIYTLKGEMLLLHEDESIERVKCDDIDGAKAAAEKKACGGCCGAAGQAEGAAGCGCAGAGHEPVAEGDAVSAAPESAPVQQPQQQARPQQQQRPHGDRPQQGQRQQSDRPQQGQGPRRDNRDNRGRDGQRDNRGGRPQQQAPHATPPRSEPAPQPEQRPATPPKDQEPPAGGKPKSFFSKRR